MASPLEQFTIKPLIPIEVEGYNISFTNSSLFMVITVFSIITLFLLCLRKRTVVPTISQSIVESAYDFIHNLLYNSAGKDGLKYFSFIFSLFLFIAFGNFLGLFPYSFTFTSHLAAVGCLSLLALTFNIIVGIKVKKWGYLRTFLPRGIPVALAPLVVPIEAISLLSKPFSLTVRLVANMTVGHIMLKILAGFIVALGLGGVVPLLFDACIIIFEMFIAVLQAYIYTVLSCIYLSDAIHHH
ncbi:MAG: F0F1 ATP synthase subunit A [Alphaproteobacteria bacterium]|nr:F0F1 ATP synthase subunit A [Alphaproteobacteria bacterium]